MRCKKFQVREDKYTARNKKDKDKATKQTNKGNTNKNNDGRRCNISYGLVL